MENTIAIDITWLRHNKVGGTETYVRNLLDGLAKVNTNNIKFVLLFSRDNAESFEMYDGVGCFNSVVCNVEACDQKKRLLWQNARLGKLLREYGIKILLEPVYSQPLFGMRDIKVITVIHDLQALHYPEYFNKIRVMWMKLCWRNDVRSSYKIIAISEYVKQDILKRYRVKDNKVEMIYDSVSIDIENCNDSSGLRKYGVREREYYYSVSSLLPHKNIITLVKTIAELKKRNSSKLYPLVVSGIGGKQKGEIERIAEEGGVRDWIKLTPFVSDAERNMLYKNCKAFLFPSVFEGFGVPPLEAMAMDVPVLTTRCASIEEVTCGCLNYVDDPFSVDEWVSRLEGELTIPEEQEKREILGKYDIKTFARKYIRLFSEIISD